MKIEKIHSLLRIAQKGRNLMIGRSAVEVLLKRKRAYLVIFALDASEKLKRQIGLRCDSYHIPVIILGTKDELGKLCSRESVAVMAVSDENMAEGIKSLL